MKPAREIAQLISTLKSYKYMMFPTLNRPMVSVKGGACEIIGNTVDLDDAFLSRVQNCYKAAKTDYQSNQGSMWSELEQGNVGFIAALESDRPELLRKFSENLYAGRLMAGMAHVQAFVAGRRTIYPKPYFALRVRDAVLSLAEALGISGLPSNQQTSWSDYIAYLNQDLTDIVAEIGKRLGYAIEAPEVGCPPVCRIGGRPFNPDFIRHAYVMHRVGQLGILPDDPILEIGGGYGCVARFACLSGRTDYTIIDLPYVNAIQMLFLGATIGSGSVSGYGEERAAVQLVPSHRKEQVAGRSYALAINMDSLPEMERSEALEYLEMASRTARYFLSINQEARKIHGDMGPQMFVSEIIAGSGLMQLLSRHKYWMEQGYTEELYAARG